jgi:hypothetical protein
MFLVTEIESAKLLCSFIDKQWFKGHEPVILVRCINITFFILEDLVLFKVLVETPVEVVNLILGEGAEHIKAIVDIVALHDNGGDVL